MKLAEQVVQGSPAWERELLLFYCSSVAAATQLALGGLALKAAWKCHYPFTAGVPPVKHEAHEMPLGQVGLEANKKQELRLSFPAPERR